MSKMNYNTYKPLLNVLCLSITTILGQIAYPDKCRSRHGRIMEVGLHCILCFNPHTAVHLNSD